MHCDRKRAYRTAREAGNAAAGRARGGVTNLRVYECPECGAFHLTHMKIEDPRVRTDTGWGYKPKPYKGYPTP